MGTFTGTAGNDTLTGTNGADSFDLHQGGEDNVQGLGGNDEFKLNGALDAGDQINGGSGSDDVTLHGDYSAGVVFTATTLVSIETVVMSAGFNYKFTTANGNVAAGASMTYNGEHLAAVNTITIDASAETDGKIGFVGGAGNDTFIGGSFADNFALSMGGEDTARGGAGNDTFAMGGALDAGDHLTGGGGSDLLRLEGDYSAGLTLADTTLNGIGGIQFFAGDSYHLTVAAGNFTASQFVGLNAKALGANGTSLYFDGSATAAGFHLEDGTGNDTLIGGQGADNAQFSRGGNDTFSGGGGDDKVIMGNKFSADDHIDGGAGNDTVELTGLQTTTVVFTAATMTNVENLLLEANHNYRITTVDQTVAAGATMLIAGNSLVGNILVFDGSAETDGHFTMRGGTGNDVLTGGAQSDTFNLLFGGNDTVAGGGGNDTVNVGAQFTAADKIDGGTGADIVTLAGDYSAGVVFGATTMANVETLSLGAGFSYALTTNDATVAAGQTLTVSAGALGAANTLTLDASAETNGFLAVTGGAGNDSVTLGAQAASDGFDGGAGNDQVSFAGNFTSGDSFNGGAGNDTLSLNGDYANLTFGASALSNVETLALGAGHSYAITTNDGNIASGQTLTVDASALGAANTLILDGSAETNGFLAVTGGAGNDRVTFAGNFTSGDSVNGGLGNDTVVLNGDYANLVLASNALTSVETLALGAGHSYSITTNDANVGAAQTLTVDASALGAANALALNAAAESNGFFAVTGGAGNDTVSFAGNYTGSDTFNGGAGNDTLSLNGTYSGTTLASLTNVETLALTGNHAYSLVDADSDVSAGQTLTVNASAAASLVFDGSPETDGSFAFIGSAGNDLLTGGAQADSFDISAGGTDNVHGGGGNDTINVGATFSAADSIDGGTGSDTITLNGDYSAGLTLGTTTLSSVEILAVAAGHSYALITNDANIAAGQMLTVDASALGAANALTLDASAETNGFLAVTGGAGNDSVIFGGNITGGDSFNGGGGNDRLTLNGDYSGGATFGATTLSNVETLAAAAGHSYVLTTNDGNIASGQTLAVDASALGAANTLALNVSAETNGFLAVTGGAGNDTVTFGGNFTSGDSFNGGAGNDTLSLNGDYANLTFGATALTSVEALTLGANHSYALVTNDANVAAGQTLTVDGSALSTFNTLFFNAAAETNGFLAVTGGAGADTLVFAGNFVSGDTFNGGAGSDILLLNGDYSSGLTFGATALTSVETLSLGTGNSYSITTNDGNIASGQTLAVNASALGAANTLAFDASAETNGAVAVTGGAGNDSVTFGAPSASDSFNGGAGNDKLTLNGDYSAGFNFSATTITNVETLALAAGHSYFLAPNDANVGAGATLAVDASALGAANTLTLNAAGETNGFFAVTGGAGNDIVSFAGNFASGDTFNGGAGSDTLVLNGDYSGGLTFGATALSSVETLSLFAGHSYSITLNDGNIAAGQTLAVDASALGANTLTLNASAETDGFLAVTGGAGNDTVTFGGNFASGDSFNGGAGTDTLLLNGDYANLTLGSLTSVENIALGAGHAYSITVTNASVAAGQTLVVNASALGAANGLSVDASALTNGFVAVTGGAGNDSVVFAGNFASGDSFNGGAGTDTLVLNGDYANLTLGASALTGVETLSLGVGHSYSITTNDANIASGQTLTVNASALGAANTLTLNIAAETDGFVAVTGGAGNDTVAFGSNYTGADTFNGGAGNDTLSLNGTYSGNTLGALTGIDTLVLTGNHAYSLVTTDATVAAAQTLAVDASGATGLTFNGAAETDGSFAITASAGSDTLFGGAQADSFDLSLGGTDAVHGGGGNDTILGGAAFTAADTIDGGAGSDTLVLNGDYSSGLILGAGTLSSVETISLAAGHSYVLTSNDGNVAAGQTLTVDASALNAVNAVVFNGSAETDGNFLLIGGAGNDTLTGGNGTNIFDLSHGGSDVANGGNGPNTFEMGAAFDVGDRINGALGTTNTLVLNGPYFNFSITNSMVSEITTVQILGNSTDSFVWTESADQPLTLDGSASTGSLTFDFSSQSVGLTYIGGGENTHITGGSGNDVFTAGTKADFFTGNGGADTFNMGANLTAADTLDGGTGSDTVSLNGDYSAGVTLGALTSIETLTLAAGHSYNLTSADVTVSAGQTLTVDGSALGAGNTLVFNGGAETDGSFAFKGSAGNDTLTGGALADSFDLNAGGIDSAHGNGGNDIFNLGAALTAADTIDGGSGNDTITLNGDYSAGVALGTLTSIEALTLAAGHSYNLTSADGTVSAGQTLTVDGSALGAANSLIFNGGAETDGSFVFAAGAGNDTLTGGALADSFDLTHGGNDTASGGGGNDTFNLGSTFTTADNIDGGTGSDSVSLNGDYSAGLAFTATTLVNIEQLLLTAGHSYRFTTADSTVAAGQVLTVDTSAFGASDVLAFNGAAETDGGFAMIAGAANDVLTGGAQADSFDLSHGGNDTASGGGGNDTFILGSTFTTADAIDGGTGSDTITLNGDYSAGITFTATMMANVEALTLAVGHSYNFTTIDATVASGSVLTVDGSALSATDILTVNGAAETNGGFALIGGAGNDVLTGGSQADSFDISKGGNDTIKGGAGNDTIQAGGALNGSDSIDGGAGNDTVAFNGDYSTTVNLASAIVNVETFAFATGHNYNLSIGSGTVPALSTLTVDGSALGAGDSLTFNGNSVSGILDMIGGAGADVLTGGAGNDIFDLSKGGADTVNGATGNDTFQMGGALTASDSLNGGSSGSDTVVLNGDYSAGVTLGANTLLNIATLRLTGGHSYNITTNDGDVGSGNTLVIDASSLGAGDSFTFNGTAETDGRYQITDGAGNDVITGGSFNDIINVTQGGTDIVHGGAGSDEIALGTSYTAADVIDGGSGSDNLFLSNANWTLTLSGTAFQSIEGLQIGSGANTYHFTTTDDLVAAGQTFTVFASSGLASFYFDGSAETDGSFNITASNSDDTIIVGGVATSVNGGVGNDLIVVSNSRFTAADSFNGGGGGNDTLELTGDFSAGVTLGSTDLVNMTTLSFAAGSTYVVALSGSALTFNQTLTVDGSALGAANSFVFDATQTERTNTFDFIGGAGNDTVNMGAEFSVSDQYNGNGGSDTLTLSGSYSGQLFFNANTISNVGTIKVGAGNSYNIVLQEGNIASGHILTADGSALTAGGIFDFSTTQLTHGGLNYLGGAGDDVVTLGATADANTVTGNSGNDTAIFANITAGDSFNGGAGNDTLALNGNFTAGVTLGAAMFGSVETLSFVQSNSYNVTLVDADIASGATLTVNDSGLGSTDSLTLDDSQETNGILHLIGSLGNETYSLGADFTSSTQINGGNGGNDTVILNGDFNETMGTQSLLNIGKLVLSAGHNYTFTANGSGFSTFTQTIDASALGASNFLNWNSNGGFYDYAIIGGAGNDVIIGSPGDTYNMSHGGDDTVTGSTSAETFTFGATLTAADTINGGAGSDTVSISGDYSAGLTLGAATFTSVETLSLGGGNSYSLVMNDANVASGATLAISAVGLTSANTLTFDGTAETDGFYSVTGGAGNDTFNMGAALKVTDQFNGNSGTDTLNLNGDYSAQQVFTATTISNIDTLSLAAGHSYNLLLQDANVASAATMTVDASALGAGNTLTFGDSDSNGRLVVLGGAGDDNVTYGAAMNTFYSFNGGAGNDTLTLNASQTLTFTATTITNVERIAFAGGTYSLTTNDGNVAAGATLIVDASALSSSSPITFNGGAETDGSFNITGGAGTDVLTGGAQADTFTMSVGGNDTVHGGGGNDLIVMGASFASGDALDGGTGNDTVSLNGAVYTGITFTAAEFTSVETLSLAAGNNYGLTTVDGNVASAQTLTVDASALAAANTLTFNGAAETDGSFVLIGGAGNDTLSGGAKADTFDLTHGGGDTVHGGGGNDIITMGAAFDATDALDGGTGTDTVQLSGGNYTALTLTASELTSIETLSLGAGNNYGITTNDANVASGQSLTVDASALSAANTLTFNGTAETNGGFTVIGGAGNDVITGGGGADTFTLTQGGNDTLNMGGGNDIANFGAAFTTADMVNGGTGTDTVTLSGDYSSGLSLTGATLTSVETLNLFGAFTYHVTVDDTVVAAGATLAVIGDTLSNITFDGSAETDGFFAFTGSANNDALTGGALADSFTMSMGGNDIVQGGGGNDTFSFGNTFTSADSVDGGAGNDTLTMSETYTGTLTNVVNVEMMTLSGGTYNITTADSTVAAGQTLTVDASASGGLTFNGAAETDGAFGIIGGNTGANTITGGAGNDIISVQSGSLNTVEGGAGNDTIEFGTNFLTNTGTIDGGDGNDTLILETGEYGVFELSGLTSIETVKTGFGDYSIYVQDNDIAAGSTLTIDGSAVGSNETFNFDASAVTIGHFVVTDGAGDDTITGGALSDTFIINAGTDVVHGGGGDDSFYLTSGFDPSSDTLDGGTGNDTIVFNTGGGWIFFDNTLKSVETFQFLDGHSYDVIMDNGSATSGETMMVDASALVTGTLTFDGSDVFTSPFHMIGGAGDDKLTGGGNNDTFDLTKGGNDTVHTGGGADTILMGATLNSGDLLVGSSGGDDTVVVVDGNYASGISIGGTLQDVGTLQLTAGHSYTVTADSSTTADNEEMLVDGSHLTAGEVLTFTDIASTGSIDVADGAGNDVLTGSGAVETFILNGGGNDTVTGNGGGDFFRIGTSDADTFVYNAVSDSTSTTYDSFSGLNFSTDILKLNTGQAVTGIDATITSGFVTESSFDSNLANNVNSFTLAAHHAVLFTVTGGSLNGHTLLVVDQNGTAGYQASADLVFDVTGYGGTLSVSSFA